MANRRKKNKTFNHLFVTYILPSNELVEINNISFNLPGSFLFLNQMAISQERITVLLLLAYFHISELLLTLMNDPLAN